MLWNTPWVNINTEPGAHNKMLPKKGKKKPQPKPKVVFSLSSLFFIYITVDQKQSQLRNTEPILMNFRNTWISVSILVPQDAKLKACSHYHWTVEPIKFWSELMFNSPFWRPYLPKTCNYPDIKRRNKIMSLFLSYVTGNCLGLVHR